MNFFLSSRWSVRLALIIIALLALIALTSQWWLPYDPQAIDLPSRLLSPDAQHWLGTDHLGRDIFSRMSLPAGSVQPAFSSNAFAFCGSYWLGFRPRLA